MIYHLVVGDEAAKPLSEAISSEPSLQGEIIVLKDILHVGPIKKEDGKSFSQMRSEFWQEVVINEKNPVVVDDLERVLKMSNELQKNVNAKVWFWMAPAPADVCAYQWLLHYLSKHLERLYVLNIAGLPFLDDTGKLFYPKNITEIAPRELIKARKLARQVTPSEMEIDMEEWNNLIEENAGIRTHEAGKKMVSRNEDFYDEKLISFCSQQFQKASKIIRQALSKYYLPTGDLYLAWRLRKMAEAGKIKLLGDVTKAMNEWEVKLPSLDLASEDYEQPTKNL